MKKTIDEKFLWGGSSAAFQIEGGWDADGREPSVLDTKIDIPKNITDFKVASDHYHHWKEDIKWMSEAGFKSYRFSISWSRVWSFKNNAPNKPGIKFYNDVIDELIKYKIEPIITMYHFDLPDHLQQQGGWLSRATIDEFERYAKLLVETFGKKVKYWLTINEQNMMSLVPEALYGKKAIMKETYQSNHHMFLAQAKAIKIVHQLSDSLVGPAPNINSIYPNSNKPEDYLAAINFANIRNWYYLDVPVFGRYNEIVLDLLAKNNSMFDIKEGDMDILSDPLSKPDFIAFNYYTTATVKAWDLSEDDSSNSSVKSDQQSLFGIKNWFQRIDNSNLPKTQFQWEIDPLGFKTTMLELTTKYHLPLLLTENGIAALEQLDENNEINDQYRIDFYTAHLKQMFEAMEMGVDLIGFNPWSAIDLVSSHQGMLKRYGFIFVNRTDDNLKDMKRYPKKSFYWYKEVIKTNGKNIK
ncbi:6-phospho-beta-glucosidase [Williamsoniiplasma luminosum]|uniref:6-phospho-beta-glucosidase n=1 Tax=Williamsoniiplasma luminosum TaxID=214888 RepID=A0A2K8NUP5_9MOLU|nr:glycoside hydrolase family 1 protein [Williamsoniiplasma luminosum]ATZ17565.1 6-phospho-beta-glucosidase [Williamsoniiplasma luminosum]